jgi:hypothetical protein
MTMNEKGGPSVSTVDADEKGSDGVPEKYRDAIVKAYELPPVKITLFTLLGYGDKYDFCLQIVGSVLAVGTGYCLDIFAYRQELHFPLSLCSWGV